MKFTPIHTFRPEKQGLDFGGDKNEVEEYKEQRYIQLTNGESNNYNAVSLKQAQTKPNNG
jgi:hypothetical protein